jgi:DNA invertase Pin-like site-specific DNA recombinase
MRTQSTSDVAGKGIAVAAVYCRISDDKEGAGLGVARQRQDCEKRAAELGFAVSPVDYSDNDLSAYSGKRRPGYERLLDDVKAGKVQAVLAWHTDRLHRAPVELEAYIDATAGKGTTFVPTYTVTGGLIDLSTPQGRMLARQLGVYARYESEHRAERISRKHQQSAELGRYRGGSARIFGYQDDAMTLHPLEAPMIVNAYQRVIDGEALGSIIRDWNSAGVTSTNGKPWNYSTLRQVLTRPRNYGASQYRGEIVGAGQWQPLVDEPTWRTCTAVLADPKRRLSTSNAGKYLLAGIALCGICEAEGRRSVMRSGSAGRSGQRWVVYKCQTGAHLARRASYCDDYVTGLVLRRLAAPDAAESLIAPTDRDGHRVHQLEAEAIRRQLDETLDLYTEGILTAGALRETTLRLRSRLSDVESKMVSPQIAGAVTDIVQAEDPALLWESMTWRAKRSVVQALMTVVIEPVPAGRARTFDPEFVRIGWK